MNLQKEKDAAGLDGGTDNTDKKALMQRGQQTEVGLSASTTRLHTCNTCCVCLQDELTELQREVEVSPLTDS